MNPEKVTTPQEQEVKKTTAKDILGDPQKVAEDIVGDGVYATISSTGEVVSLSKNKGDARKKMMEASTENKE
jgi:hypothetical protein